MRQARGAIRVWCCEQPITGFLHCAGRQAGLHGCFVAGVAAFNSVMAQPGLAKLNLFSQAPRALFSDTAEWLAGVPGRPRNFTLDPSAAFN